MIFECEYLKESTAVPDKNHKYPVYVVLMNGKSPLAKIILKVTGDYFSHSCIAFNSKLDPLYSFATKSEKQGGGMGFSISKPQDRSCFGKQAYYSVYVTYVTAEEIKKMKEVMDKFISKEKDLRYDFTGLVKFALNKDSETHTDYFCSRFVAEVLSVGVKLDKAASLYKPQDFATFKEFTLINRGFDFVNYDHKITERNEKLLKEGKFNPDEVFFESAATQIVKDEKGDYKERLKLSAFTKVTLTDAITRVYSRKVSSLERITINNKTKGFIWLDNSNDCVVAVANVMEKDDGTKWIQTFEIFHPYQGKGLSKQILDIVIRELQGQYISVQKSSDVAIKVLKSKGFKQFKSGENNIFMSRDNSTEEDIDESSITENMILNKKDLEINIDKFESGKTNVLLVTGFSGSGKSTLAASLATKYKCTHYELDCLDFYLSGQLTRDNLIDNEDGLVAFIDKKKLQCGKVLNSKQTAELYKEYIKFLISWCKKQTDKKFIIEGLQIYETYEDGDSHITSCPMIIKGTSGLVSAIRAAKRNDRSFAKEFGPLLKWAFKDNKALDRLKKTMLHESIIEEGTKSTIDNNYKSKGKKRLSSFKIIHITEEIINKYKKEYPFLSHVRCKDTKEYVCDGYIWFDNNELVATVGSCEYQDDKTKWIVSLEITKKYRGYGLSEQILDYAVKTMKCKYLSVNKNNEIAKRVYDKYGFKVYQESDTMYYMTLDKNTIKDIKESTIEIEGEGGFFDRHNRWNPVVKINGEQYRYRVECLVIRGTRVFLSKNPQTGEFIIPGGGVDKILSNEEQVAKECQEEARMVITNIENTGVVYVNRRGVSEKGKKLPVEEQWVGAYNEMYIADYVGHYRGAVEKVDQDPAMMKGRFVEIEQVYEKLRPEWQEALATRFDIEVVEESVKFYKNPRIALKRKNTIKKNSNINVGKNDDVGLSTPDNSVKKESGKVPNTDIGKAAEDARKLLTKEIFACKDGAAAYDNLMCPKDNGFAIINWNLSKLKHDSDKANFPKYRDAVFSYCKRQFDQTHPNYELLCDNLTQCFWIRPIQ